MIYLQYDNYYHSFWEDDLSKWSGWSSTASAAVIRKMYGPSQHKGTIENTVASWSDPDSTKKCLIIKFKGSRKDFINLYPEFFI